MVMPWHIFVNIKQIKGVFVNSERNIKEATLNFSKKKKPLIQELLNP
jgi:hypothetical protein